MTSRHLVDPELEPLLEVLPAFELDSHSLPHLRHWMTEQAGRQPEAVECGQIRRWEHHVLGPAGAPPVRVLVYTPREAELGRPALLHIHGGGFVSGSPEGADARNAALATELGCILVSVDYRLSPETRFPGAVEDCYAALHWLHEQAESLGVDPGRIAILGESAGGGLAACLALLTRDRGEIKPVLQLLVYPMLDDRTATTVSPSPLAGEFVWTAGSNRFGWKSLLGHDPGGADVSPYAAAARATDLAGLPPCFIGVGALDLFVDEDIAYSRRLIEAGVPTELHVYPGAFHGFDQMRHAHVTRRFVRDVEAALRLAFGLSDL